MGAAVGGGWQPQGWRQRPARLPNHPPSLSPPAHNNCASLGLTLATGACSGSTGALLALGGEAGSIPGLDCAARAARSPNPPAACCADLAVFAAAGCGCDGPTLATAAALGGLSRDSIAAGLALAAASCPTQHGIGVADSCGGAGAPCG